MAKCEAEEAANLRQETWNGLLLSSCAGREGRVHYPFLPSHLLKTASVIVGYSEWKLQYILLLA